MKRLIGDITFAIMFVALCAITVGAIVLIADAAGAQPDVCPEAGKVEVQGPASITVTAPEGQLITGYCVKAGPTTEYVSFDPPLSTVTIAHTSGKDISHYTLDFTEWTPTPEPTSTPDPTPEPEPLPTPSPQPTAPPEPTPSPQPSPEATPSPCYEDMPCWDCETMGNKKCGEVETSTPPPPGDDEPTPPSVTPKSDREVLAYTGAGEVTSYIALVGLALLSLGLGIELTRTRSQLKHAQDRAKGYERAFNTYIVARMKRTRK